MYSDWLHTRVSAISIMAQQFVTKNAQTHRFAQTMKMLPLVVIKEAMVFLQYLEKSFEFSQKVFQKFAERDIKFRGKSVSKFRGVTCDAIHIKPKQGRIGTPNDRVATFELFENF